MIEIVVQVPVLVSPVPLRDSIQERIRRTASSSEARRIVIARADGLVIAHNLSSGTDAKRLAAMSATLVGAATTAASATGQGVFREVTVEAGEGRLVCVQAGDEAIVTGMLPQGANVGLALLVMRRLAEEVAGLIDDASGDYRSP